MDYNGVEITEDFYFNLNKAEIMNWHLTTVGGLRELIEKIINSKDQTEMIRLFQELIDKSYGEKTADGKRFRKLDDNGRPLYIGFKEKEAYSVLYMELITDDRAAAEFVNGIIPNDIAEEVAKEQLQQLQQLPQQN